jgi:hypothetical protein
MYTTKDTREAHSHIHTQSNTHKRLTDRQETRDQKQQTNNSHEKKPKKDNTQQMTRDREPSQQQELHCSWHLPPAETIRRQRIGVRTCTIVPLTGFALLHLDTRPAYITTAAGTVCGWSNCTRDARGRSISHLISSVQLVALWCVGVGDRQTDRQTVTVWCVGG